MPTNDEIRALAERLERHDAWRLFQGLGTDDGFPERFDDAPKEAAAMLRHILAEREEALDKIDGLQSDLDSAIAVMRRRVSGDADIASMGEWLDLNYPVKRAAL